MTQDQRLEAIQNFDPELFTSETEPHRKKTFAIYLLLKHLITDDVELPTPIQQAISYLMPLRMFDTRRPSKKDSAGDYIAEMFTAKKIWTVREVWDDKHLRPAELRKVIQEALDTAAPQDRYWIEMNPRIGIWELKKVGGEAPASYTGPYPADQELANAKTK